MSSMPPGGGQPPYPPYDPKTQYKVYREQQKAAWRAQRNAWKAQRYAYRAGYGGAYGPRVPSIVGPIILIGFGVVALLVVTGHIAAGDFWGWYSHWWPLLLIGAGLAMLAEWALDLRRATPVHRSGNFAGILVLLAILGIGASGWNHIWGPLRAEFGDKGDEFFNSFGLPEHDLDQQVINTQVPADAAIEIQNPRGDVSITSGESSSVVIQAHQVAFANSDSDAKRIFNEQAPHVTVSGNAVLLKSGNNSKGRVNLTVTVPRGARVTVNSGWGDVTAAGLGAGIDVTARGDIHLSSIAGPVVGHFIDGRHDEFSAHGVKGDLTLDGNLNDLTLSEIKGKVTQSGDLLGNVHLETISGPVHLHTSVTTLSLMELPGDLTLDSDDLRVTDAKGEVRVVTRSKDVDLSRISGDSYVEDRDGRISVEPAGNYGVEAKNGKGDVEVTLPPNVSAIVDGHTRNGDIVTDYSLSVSGDEAKTVTGRIGSGGPKISLSADNGDLRIKKGTAISTSPAPPATPESPAVPHLKAPRAHTPEPVTQ